MRRRRSSAPGRTGFARSAAFALALAAGAAGLVVAAGACGPTESPTEGEPADTEPITRETFVDVYVSLLRARTSATDSADVADARRAVLERHHVDADALRAFVDRHADDVTYLADLWAAIRERTAAVADSIAAADSAAVDSAATDAVPGMRGEEASDGFPGGRSDLRDLPEPPRRGPPDDR